jgi:hypothetical protein
VQAALKHFRASMLENISPLKKETLARSNEYNKEGPEKRFVFRESLLSAMFEIRDFRTIYNMVMASFIILTVSLLYDSFMKKGEIVDMIALFGFFRGTKSVIVAWIALSLIFFCIIFITKIALKTTRYIWIPLYLCHITVLLSAATYFSKSSEMGFGSVIIIMAEAIRMIMKAHSYLRTKLLYLKEN